MTLPISINLMALTAELGLRARESRLRGNARSGGPCLADEFGLSSEPGLVFLPPVGI
jgi:hypothetical protein